MLGVVRVFARKSTIVLSDVTAILQTLSRYTATSASVARGRKRLQDAEGKATEVCAAITLDPLQAKASFDDITLPGPGRKRRRRGEANFSFGDTFPGASIDHHDMVAAMADLFPSLPPRSAQKNYGNPSLSQQHSRSMSGNVLDRTARRRVYQAREEDITLPPVTSSVLDAVAMTDLFEDDDAIGVQDVEQERSRKLNDRDDVPIVRELFMRREAVEQLSGSSAREGGPPSIPEADLFGVDLAPFQPIDLKPLHLDLFTTAPENIPPAAERPFPEEEQIISEQKHDIVPSREHCIHTHQPNEARRETNVGSEEARPVQDLRQAGIAADDTEAIQRRNGSSDLPITRRKRGNAITVDIQTELSPQQFRAFLNDTSDIVLQPDQDRPEKRRGRGRKRSQKFMNEMPSFIGRFAKELRDMWQDIADIGAEANSSVGDDANEGQEGVASQGSGQGALFATGMVENALVSEGRAVVFGGSEAAGGTDALPPMSGAVDVPEDVDILLSDVADLRGSVERGSSSVEQMRAVTKGVEQERLASGSLGGRSLSISAPSGIQTSSQGRDVVRDRLFDMVSILISGELRVISRGRKR